MQSLRDGSSFEALNAVENLIPTHFVLLLAKSRVMLFDDVGLGVRPEFY